MEVEKGEEEKEDGGIDSRITRNGDRLKSPYNVTSFLHSLHGLQGPPLLAIPSSLEDTEPPHL